MNRLARLLSPGSTLSQRVVRGSVWVLGVRVISRLLGMVRTIMLARVLAPGDFGLFGAALLALSMLDQFSQTGFEAALIQKKEDTKSYLDTAWTVQAIRGVVLAVILSGLAPHIAAFLGQPEVSSLLRVVALSVVLEGLINVGIVYFRKELEFQKQVVFQLSGSLIDACVAVAAAILLRSVWALVLGLIAGKLARLVVSYWVDPYRPSIRYERHKAKELHGFGRWVLGSGILVFLATQGDDVFVAKYLGVEALGLYQLAYQISNAPATEIAHMISQVSFPAYSKLQDRRPSLRRAYLSVLQVTVLLSVFLAGMTLVLAPEFTGVFLGEKWMPMVPAMQILAIAGLLRAVSGISGHLFLGVGNPRIDTALQTVRLLVLALLVFPLTRHMGIAGTSLAVMLANALSGIGFGYMGAKIACCTMGDFSKAIVPAGISGLIMVSLVYVFNTALSTTGFWQLLASGVIGLVSYCAANLMLDRLLGCGMYSLVRDSIAAFLGV